MPTRAFGLLTLICLFLMPLCRADTSADVIRRGKKATVLVQAGEAEGTAFCIAASGLFVTNQHVVADLGQGALTLVLNAGEATQRIVQATVVRSDKEADIALLQAVETEGFTQLPLGDSESLLETQAVIAFGYPFGSDLAIGKEKFPAISINVGRITALRRVAGSLREIQLDAVLNPGNSGGPVINEKGEVVGIVRAGVVGAGVNFAIPVTRLHTFLHNAQAILRPPTLTQGNQALLQTFGIDLLSVPKPGAHMGATLSLTAPGQETRDFAAAVVGGARFRVVAIPIPVPVDVPAVRIRFKDATSEGDYVVRNKVVSIGGHVCKLSEVRRIARGVSPYALMADGQKFRGEVTGLTAVEVVGPNSLKINVSEYQDLRVEVEGAKDKPLAYRIVVREDGQIICDTTGVLTVGGAEPEQSAPVASPVKITQVREEGGRFYNPANGHWYEAVAVQGGCTWFEAFAAAKQRLQRGLHGHLVTITSEVESQFIAAHMPQALMNSYWLGGYQDTKAPDYREPDGGWRWVTGEPWRYTNWDRAASQPDNAYPHEDFLQFFGHELWNDAQGSSKVSGYVVEYEFLFTR